MYRQAMRKKVVTYVYDAESKSVTQETAYAYAIIGKETTTPTFTYSPERHDNKKVVNYVFSDDVESGYIAMRKADFMSIAKYAKSPYVGGVNVSGNNEKMWTVTGTYFDPVSLELVEDFTADIPESELFRFAVIDKKVAKASGYYGMSAWDFANLGYWCDTTEEAMTYA